MTTGTYVKEKIEKFLEYKCCNFHGTIGVKYNYILSYVVKSPKVVNVLLLRILINIRSTWYVLILRPFVVPLRNAVSRTTAETKPVELLFPRLPILP